MRRYNPLKRKKRGFGERPVWAPLQVDYEAGKVSPLPSWLMLKEAPQGDETASGLAVVRSMTNNTVYGEIRAIHPEFEQEAGLHVGDTVIYSEWRGGRWSFAGETLLIIHKRHILAKVVMPEVS